MPFIAKPSGGYNLTSSESINNMYATYDYMSQFGYTRECITGILGNVYAESGMNPWLWQNGVVDLTDPYTGYGLFQYTPAYEYINGCTGVPNYAPSLSTGSVDPSASPDDALAQLYVFINDTLGKWSDRCWRNYWSQTDYADYYNSTRNIISTYGSNNRLSMNEFKSITNYNDASDAFLACFEGPTIPNYLQRRSYAAVVWNYIGPYTRQDNLIVTLKVLDTNHKRKFNNI